MRQTNTRHFPIVHGTYGQLLAQLDAWRTDGGRHVVCFCDANGLSRAWCCDVELRAAYARADAVCPDGVSAAWMARLSGGVDTKRLVGPEVFARALSFGVARGWRHYLYGTDGTTLEALKTNVERRWPGVRIVGMFAPEFSEDPPPPPIEKGAVDFLWVALGCPKQEKWCVRHRADVEAPVLLAVGAAFDFLAGTAREAPRFVQALGLCWLWRLLTGGRRVRIRNARCVVASLLVLFREWCFLKGLRKRRADYAG